MKKILIAILLLVPFLIIFTLNVSGTIVSAQVEIGVERMVMMHQGDEVNYVVINLEDYVKNNRKYTLFVSYTPSFVSNKEVKWYSSDESVAVVKKSGQGAAVSFIEGSYGTVDIIATSMSDTSVSAVCSFYITGNEIGKIELLDYADSQPLSVFTMVKNQCKQLRVKVTPSEALGTKHIDWESLNTDIVRVNQNGVLTAVNVGETYITASVQTESGKVSTRLKVSVSGTAPVNANLFYCFDDTFNLNSVLSSSNVDIISVSGGTVQDGILSLTADRADIKLRGDVEQTVTVLVKKSNALCLQYQEEYMRGMWKIDSYVELGSACIYVNAVATNGQNVNDVVWSTADPNIAVINNNRICGVGSGKTVVMATADGYEPLEFEITVTEKVGDVKLNFNELDDMAGLAEERVFGALTCNEDLVVANALPLQIARVYPESVRNSEFFYSMFTFSTEDETLALVDGNGVVSFTRKAIGKSVTVTVTANFSDNFASDSYTFKVVDGINIGVNVENYYDKSADTALPDFAPFNELKFVMEQYLGDHEANGVLGAAVFQTNVYLPATQDDSSIVQLNRCIYGNGFVYDGQIRAYTYDSRMFWTGLQCERIRSLCGDDYNIVVENLYIQSYSPAAISDDSVEAFALLKKEGGVPWRQDAYADENAQLKVTFRYCMFRYAYMHLNLAGGITEFDGCIFSNSAGPALSLQSLPGTTCDVTINNCIFSNTISPVILGATGDFRSKQDNDNFGYLTARFTGKNYVYNWKLVDEVNMDIFPSSSDELLNNVLAALNAEVSSLFRLAMGDPQNKSFIHSHVKGEYINLGFVFLGAWRHQNFQVNPLSDFKLGDGVAVFMDEDLLYCGDLYLDKLQERINSNILYNQICKSYEIDFVEKKSFLVVPNDSTGNYTTTPQETYVLDRTTKDRLHGVSE